MKVLPFRLFQDPKKYPYRVIDDPALYPSHYGDDVCESDVQYSSMNIDDAILEI